jgi:hypothetical protein
MATTTYTLSCDRGGAPVTSMVTVTVQACAARCTINAAAGSHDCSGAVAQNLWQDDGVDNWRGVFTLDLGSASRLYLVAEICDPDSWVMHVGDSPTNDGAGGDASSSSNDAEVHVGRDSGATSDGLYMFARQAASSATLISDADFVALSGCTTTRFVVEDQRFRSWTPKVVDVQDADGLRLNPPTDTEGTPDALWYLGINRVVRTTSGRVGDGVTRADVCLH